MALVDSLKSLTARLEGTALDAGLAPRYPGLAVELAPDRITAVRFAPDRKSKALTLLGVAAADLPEGAIEPSLTRPNILTLGPVAAALESVLGKVGAGEPRVSLLIPDHVARVALLSFAALPKTRRELGELVRFRMAKSLPFKPEEAALDLMILSGRGAAGAAPAGASVLAVFIHRAVLEQYESLLTAAGYWPGLVGLATFELYNLFRERLEAHGPADKDALFLNITAHYLALLIFRGDDLIFYRCKPHPAGAGAEETLVGVRRELYTSLAFYQEKLLGRGIGRAFLRSTGMPGAPLAEAVRGEAGCEAEALDLLQVAPLGSTVALDAEAAAGAAPAAGAVLGRRR